LFLGSSCIYPKYAKQPLSESELLSGILEPTNEPYAIAKIAGIKLCESYNRQYGTDYRSLMPTNLYGPGDNFNLENSHVLPALIRRFHEAKESGASVVSVWGTGKARREFLFVDDLAAAAVYVMSLNREVYASQTEQRMSHINVGTGKDCDVAELADLIAEVTGFSGKILWDKSKPDGAPQKLLDIKKIKALGWQHTTDLTDGLRKTYDWYLKNKKELRI